MTLGVFLVLMVVKSILVAMSGWLVLIGLKSFRYLITFGLTITFFILAWDYFFGFLLFDEMRRKLLLLFWGTFFIEVVMINLANTISLAQVFKIIIIYYDLLIFSLIFSLHFHLLFILPFLFINIHRFSLIMSVFWTILAIVNNSHLIIIIVQSIYDHHSIRYFPAICILLDMSSFRHFFHMLIPFFFWMQFGSVIFWRLIIPT